MTGPAQKSPVEGNFWQRALDIVAVGPIWVRHPLAPLRGGMCGGSSRLESSKERRHPDACPDGRDDGGLSESRPGCLTTADERRTVYGADVYRSEAR